MEKCVKENLLKLGNSVQRHGSLKIAVCWGERPAVHYSQNIVSIGYITKWGRGQTGGV